jgi:hypothetical protein
MYPKANLKMLALKVFFFLIFGHFSLQILYFDPKLYFFLYISVFEFERKEGFAKKTWQERKSCRLSIFRQLQKSILM